MTDRFTAEEMKREINRLTERIRRLETGNTPLQGRRVIAAGIPVSQKDYIRKQEVDVLSRKIDKLTIAAKGGTAAGLTGPVVPPPTLPGECQPNHPLDLGYWFVDGRYGDYYAEVKPYCNLFVAAAGDFQYVDDSSTPSSEMLERLEAALQRAFDDDWDIYLIASANQTDYFDQEDLLDLIVPFWGSIKYVDLADEPHWDPSQLSDAISGFAAGIKSRGLDPGSALYGCTMTQHQVLETDLPTAQGLNFVTCEMYVLPAAYEDDPSQIQPYLQSLYDNFAAAVGPQKSLLVVMQGYDRNGAFDSDHIADMVTINEVTYNIVKDSTRVLGIVIFAYGRPGGTVSYVELQAIHKQISSCISKGLPPPTEQSLAIARGASDSTGLHGG